jgi:hypothetical protein
MVYRSEKPKRVRTGVRTENQDIVCCDASNTIWSEEHKI